LIEALGGGGACTIDGALNLVVAAVLLKIAPETKYESLEEIEVEMDKLYPYPIPATRAPRGRPVRLVRTKSCC
jgi:putative sugar transporter yfiG